MDRNEFMELVYETFADEPDNVLANGIIEAADAYAEHEKAQLSQEGTTFDTISRQAAIDEINHICPVDTEYDCTLLDRVDVRCVLSDLPTIQHEPAIPLSWIEKYIEWLKSFDNEFVNLAAAHISVMVKKWRDEQNE